MPAETSLEFLFPANRVYNFALHQRQYQWGEEQIIDLWRDFIRLHEKRFRDRNNEWEHSLNTIRIMPAKEAVQSKVNDFTDDGLLQVRSVEDGQQRITTLLIILNTLRHALEKCSEDMIEPTSDHITIDRRRAAAKAELVYIPMKLKEWCFYQVNTGSSLADLESALKAAQTRKADQATQAVNSLVQFLDGINSRGLQMEKIALEKSMEQRKTQFWDWRPRIRVQPSVLTFFETCIVTYEEPAEIEPRHLVTQTHRVLMNARNQITKLVKDFQDDNGVWDLIYLTKNIMNGVRVLMQETTNSTWELPNLLNFLTMNARGLKLSRLDIFKVHILIEVLQLKEFENDKAGCDEAMARMNQYWEHIFMIPCTAEVFMSQEDENIVLQSLYKILIPEEEKDNSYVEHMSYVEHLVASYNESFEKLTELMRYLTATIGTWCDVSNPISTETLLPDTALAIKPNRLFLCMWGTLPSPDLLEIQSMLFRMEYLQIAQSHAFRWLASMNLRRVKEFSEHLPQTATTQQALRVLRLIETWYFRRKAIRGEALLPSDLKSYANLFSQGCTDFTVDSALKAALTDRLEISPLHLRWRSSKNVKKEEVYPTKLFSYPKFMRYFLYEYDCYLQESGNFEGTTKMNWHEFAIGQKYDVEHSPVVKIELEEKHIIKGKGKGKGKVNTSPSKKNLAKKAQTEGPNVNRIGNQVLLEEKINESVKNKPLSQKIGVVGGQGSSLANCPVSKTYRDSHLAGIMEYIKMMHLGEEQLITRREQNMLVFAKERWGKVPRAYLVERNTRSKGKKRISDEILYDESDSSEFASLPDPNTAIFESLERYDSDDE